ncbi:MAG: long-chain fatty acid--CoA ligase, partial [Lachnospiraceae bacterium]|nr:long-chain fatty acid--CoA ligase [Lachnospiraceae bacterium]
IPMTDTNIKIVKPGTNDELFKGEIGEMCIKSPSVMKGYYNNNEETNKTMQDGWLHTGDLGYCKNGIFYFAQRKGNMIISSGVNVYPSNIEQVIEMNEAVASCAVIGIYHSYKMQVPKAYIVLKEGYEASEELKNEIASLCRKNLNIYSIPYSYEFREKLPQTLLGKISHKELAEEEQKVKVYKR